MESKKNNKGLIIALIVAIVVLVGCVGFDIYLNILKNDETLSKADIIEINEILDDIEVKLITANKEKTRLLSKIYSGDDKSKTREDLTVARMDLIDEAIDLMTAVRTLLWKLGLNDDDFHRAVERVNRKNKERGYF